jgi:hypothetical protein
MLREGQRKAIEQVGRDCQHKEVTGFLMTRRPVLTDDLQDKRKYLAEVREVKFFVSTIGDRFAHNYLEGLEIDRSKR